MHNADEAIERFWNCEWLVLYQNDRPVEITHTNIIKRMVTSSLSCVINIGKTVMQKLWRIVTFQNQ